MKAGDHVKVDFVSESATIYSGKRFTGYGVLDRVEDGRIYGRLDDGTPFMCLCADVEVVGMSDFEKWFKSLNENGRVTYFLGQEGRISEEAWNHQQSKIDELTKQRDSFIKAYEIEMDKSVELQKRIDEVLQEVKGLERFTGEDCIADFDVLRGAVSHACKRLEKALRGES